MKSKDLSKFLSLLLRHQPERLNLTMDKNGWVQVDELLQNLKADGKNVSFEDLKKVVETNNKQRFKLDEEQGRIRANQGHSIQVDTELKETTPPDILYHGTATKNMEAIKKDGLKKMNRQHVHLSQDLETATKVGSRHGKPVILKVQCQAMLAVGHIFYLSENGVWLTDDIPVGFIAFQ